MRRAASLAAGAALALLLAGCGQADPAAQRTLTSFFSASPRGRSWGRLFPHRPGSRDCTVPGYRRGRKVPATCSTDVSLVAHDRAVVTLTETWNDGNRARAWFVFVRRNGAIESVIRERLSPGDEGG